MKWILSFDFNKPIFLFRDELEKRGLSKAGKKDELIQRLQSYLEVSITRVYILKN